MRIRPPKRPIRILGPAAGFALLLALVAVVALCGPRSGPTPRRSPTSSPVGIVTARPTPWPSLRPPTVITTPVPTASPAPAGPGKG